MLGRALLDLDRADEAIPHLEAAVKVDPALLLPLSRAYKAKGRAEDAARAEAEYRRRQN
jgi:predicted Zn-dependent protease